MSLDRDNIKWCFVIQYNRLFISKCKNTRRPLKVNHHMFCKGYLQIDDRSCVMVFLLCESSCVIPGRRPMVKLQVDDRCIVMVFLPCESSYVIPGWRLMLKLKIYINWRYISGKSHMVWYPCDSSYVYEVHYFERKLYHTGYTEIVTSAAPNIFTKNYRDLYNHYMQYINKLCSGKIFSNIKINTYRAL